MKNLGDLRYMEIKHAAEKGKGSLHWYTSVALSKDLRVRNALIDTGASFSTIECRLLAMLNYQELDDFREMVRSTSSDVITPHLAIEPNDDGASANLDHLIEYKPKIDGSAEIKVLQ